MFGDTGLSPGILLLCRKTLDMQPRAIETHYKGYRFRSRLEARWAVFFDALGLRWEYEPEGFELPSGRYLPDFYLPHVGGGLWVEIKPTKPTPAEHLKLNELARATRKTVTFRVGEPMINVLIANGDADFVDPSRGYDIDNAYMKAAYIDNESGDLELGEDGPYLFCSCPWCGRVGFEFDGRGARVCGYKAHYPTEDEALAAIKHLGHWRADDKCYTGNHQKILNAALDARGARFEYGESGAKR